MDSRTGLAGLKANDTSYVALCLFSEIFIRVGNHKKVERPVFVLVFYDLYVTHDLSDDFGAL